MYRSVPCIVGHKYCSWLGWNQWACISKTKKFCPWPFSLLEPNAILLPPTTCPCEFFSSALRELGWPYKKSDKCKIQVRTDSFISVAPFHAKLLPICVSLPRRSNQTSVLPLTGSPCYFPALMPAFPPSACGCLSQALQKQNNICFAICFVYVFN